MSKANMPSKDLFLSRKSTKSGYDIAPLRSARPGVFAAGSTAGSVTTWVGCGTGNGRRMIASTKLKIDELAPMAIPMETIAVIAKPGFWRRARNAYRMSFIIGYDDGTSTSTRDSLCSKQDSGAL